MADLTHHKEIGGEAIHVRDCYIWAEIHYLDSPSDYREYLPKDQARRHGVLGDDLILLDSPRRGSSVKLMSELGALLLLLLSAVLLFHLV